MIADKGGWCSIIAGNHDLTLHPAWYEKEWQNWHKMDGKQVGLTPLAHSGARLTEFITKQDTAVAAKMVKGDRAKKAGIVYLEDEEYKFQVREGGKTWSIYGSPVSGLYCSLCSYLCLNLYGSAVVTRILQSRVQLFRC